MSAPDRSRAPAPGPLRPFHFPAVHRARLPNGLGVLVAENHAFPLVTADLVLPAGALADPPGAAGVASLTAGLMESGAGARDAAAFAEEADALGLLLENGVSWETALAGVTGLRSRLDAAMGLLAEMAVRPTFPAREVERIRDERLTVLAQRRADPSGLADELAVRYTFPETHPYSRRMSGMRETLSAIGRADVQGFHAAQYRPAGGWLLAAGDVTVDEVMRMAEAHFGGWEGAPPPREAPAPVPRFDRTTIILADRPGSVQAELRVAHPGPERSADDFFAVTVMNALLGGTFSSRLNLTLRERLGYTYGISSSVEMRRVGGIVSVSSAVQSEGTAHAVAEVLREMRTLQEERVPADEVADASGYLAGIFPLGMETTVGLSGRLSTLALHGLADDYFDDYRDRLVAVTPEEVRTAARRRLMPDRAAVVVVGDASQLRGPLEALDAGPVEVIDPAEVLR